MNQIILQPCGSSDGRQHDRDTVESPVSLDRVGGHLSSEYVKQLEAIYDGRGIPTWGVTPGITNSNVGKWARVSTGDVVLFSAEKRIFASGTVSMKAQSSSLAESLWGRDTYGQTWEYVYFLDEMKSLEIPYPVFNRVAG